MSDTKGTSVQAQQGVIKKEDIIARVLERYPQTIAVFLQFGFTPLKDPASRQQLAANTTIEQAARVISADQEALLAALNRIRAAVDASGTATIVSLPITGNHLVGEVTEAFPTTLDVFLRHGFAHLADESMRRTVAKTVTIEMASRIHGIELTGFLTELNAAAAS